MCKYYIHEKNHLEAAKAYQTIYDTYNKADAELNLDSEGGKKAVAFQNFVFFLLLSPYSNEKVDLLNIVEALYPRELEQNELLGKFVKKFLTFEIMPLNEGQVEQEISRYEPFTDVTENNKLHTIEFLKQFIQHNIRGNYINNII